MDLAPSDRNPHLPPSVVLTAGLIAISTGAIFARLAEAPSLVIAAYRVGIASLVILPIAALKTRHEITVLSRSDLKYAGLAAAFLAFHFATWISSLKYTSVANSVVLVNTSPLWVGLLAPFITKEKMKRSTAISIIVSISGIFIIGSGDLGTGGMHLRGDMLALLGGGCTAGYLLMGRTLRAKLSLLAYISVCYGGAALILWVLVLAMRLQITGFSDQTIAAFWSMAIIAQLIGHSSYNFALKYLSTSFVAVSLLGEPVGSTILAYIIFDEGLSWSKVVGGMFILGAIFLAAKSELTSNDVREYE